MCGFIGCVYDQKTDKCKERLNKFHEANSAIIHRGPDDEGSFYDDHSSFAFRRLSIIDVEKGHQPLNYKSRYWIVFNGEIYNHIELRALLEEWEVFLHPQSDTEVIVALFDLFGKEVVHRLRGMFSFLIWDTTEKTLFGARDHFGIKPLYYYQRDGELYFASEKKSLLPFLNQVIVNHESLEHMLSFQYVPEPSTMDLEIKKVLPGTCFTKKINEEVVFEHYWKVQFRPSVNKDETSFAKEICDVVTASKSHSRRCEGT